jgi:hypothetical protein
MQDLCSLFIAVDNHYLDKLLCSYPTWLWCHPEIIGMTHVFVFDSAEVTIADKRWGDLARMRSEAALAHGSQAATKLQLIPWKMDHSLGISQREEMLTGLVRCVDRVRTPWYLKVDADSFAVDKTPLLDPAWFENEEIAYVSSPWGYTRPAGTVAKMNTWAAGIPELAGFPDVPFRSVTEPKAKDCHSRMASWVMLGRTSWTIWASGLCKDARLPFPSQDTYLAYVQARTNAKWIACKFHHRGASHCRNFGGLQAACAAVMAKVGPKP